jgi:hypothetical protein
MLFGIGVLRVTLYNPSGALGSIDLKGKVGMTNSSIARANIVGFIAVLALSAITMVWLFWHHPVKTIIATIAVLAALGVSARLARSIEADNGAGLDRSEHIV